MQVTDVTLTLMMRAVNQLLQGEEFAVPIGDGSVRIVVRVDDAVAEYYRNLALAQMPVASQEIH